jgi:hypothetical protein
MEFAKTEDRARIGGTGIREGLLSQPLLDEAELFVTEQATAAASVIP